MAGRSAIPIQPVDSAEAAEATAFFRPYTQQPSTLPSSVWWALRVAALLATLALVALLLLRPALGLTLFWGLTVPLLPALLVLAPGLWRQVCPMATLNQLPRSLGHGLARELPARWKAAAFGIAVLLFVSAVTLRAPLLNQQGPAVAAMMLAALVLAAIGGWVFKGRSGWCGTFCPLAPIQRDYGQAPVLLVRNGHCEPCVGCQKNCYDFNPRAAVFSDLDDEDPRWSGQRRLFMGLLPGLILGYFVAGPAVPGGAVGQGLALLGSAAASAGLYALALAYVPATPYRVSLAFSAAALAIFYVFAGPLWVDAAAGLLGRDAPEPLRLAARCLGLLLALALVGQGAHAETLYRRARQARQAQQKAQREAAARPPAEPLRTQFGGGQALKSRLLAPGQPEVTDRETGMRFPVAPGATLLEGIEAAGLKISFGCRAGVCGADAVVVCAGQEHLSPPTEEEEATLQRMGLLGRARLACMCSVSGPVRIDRDPAAAPGPASVLLKPKVDLARRAGIQRVVIVGDGVAGMGAAEALRRDSDSVRIAIVAHEAQRFYNRMGIARLIHDDGDSADALALVPPDWPQVRDVQMHRGSVAARIDRDRQQLLLADGQTLPYDRLILATGARCTTPTPDFLTHRNAFVLRSVDDALAIRAFVRANKARRALVIGGGVLGVEAADALRLRGLQVTLLQRAPRLMNAQLDEPGAARLAAYLDGLGIQVVTGASVARFEGEPDLQAACLAHGPRVRADLFVACLGVTPNVHLAQQASLALGRGVTVDAQLRSSDPHILAIGDVAEPPGGGPAGLWPLAAAQAGVAVAGLWGEAPPYQPPRTVLKLKCDGIALHSWGELSARDGDEHWHAAADDPAWWSLRLRDGRLVGGLYVGPPGAAAKAFANCLQQPPAALPSWRDALRAGDLSALTHAAATA